MKRRLSILMILVALLVFATACTNKKVVNPLADVNSKQPDKVLFDRALDALKHNRFEVARLSLQTLINTYPDSEYIARAKLGVADSWYAEGGTAANTQAEIEYKDFQTFFPNMPEAAEAQYKIANIHYQEMEKADRDFTHALRAEDEYRQMMLQYPDSKLLPQARQRLLAVQEVLGEREFRVGRFYYLRESYPAAIARLRSMAEKYPLYSKADEAYYLLGQSYEAQITRLEDFQAGNAAGQAVKAKAIREFSNNASAAYAHIVERYPAGLRADAAKDRLLALHHPVPTPTQEAMARSRKEMEGRESPGMMGKFVDNFRRHPDASQATKVGDPTLVDPQIVSATQIAQETVRAMSPAAEPTTKVSAETIQGTVTNEAAPRSDAPPANPPASDAAPNVAPSPAPAATSLTDPSAPAAANPYGELKPDTSAAPAPSDAPPPAPSQTNEIQPGSTPPGAKAADSNQNPDNMSSSKGKKKKGLKRAIPF
jgi:outer membrane protein assembly factor BamD